MRGRKHNPDPCPAEGCGSTIAHWLHGNTYRCKAVGCGNEFTRTAKRASRLRAKPKSKAEREESYVENYGALGDVVRSMPCLVQGCRSRRVEVCHVTTRGAGGGAWVVNPETGRLDGNLIPFCMEHHREQHSAGVETFPNLHTLVIETMTSYAEPATLAEAAWQVGVIAKSRGVDPRTNKMRKGAA